MGLVKDQLWRLRYRAPFYLDFPSLMQLLKFKQLRDRYYRDLWQQAATNINAHFQDWNFGYGRISRHGLTTVVKEGTVMLDDHLTLKIMGNKALVYALMVEKGYAVPDFRQYSMVNFSEGEDFFLSQKKPVVVKPTSGTGGGRGVTTGITTLKVFRKASLLASSFDTNLIIEEQIEGQSYRLLYLDGKFIDAVRRDPPIIKGDGRHTIRQLVAIENKKRLAGRPVVALSPLKIDKDCLNKLHDSGLKIDVRPDPERIIELKRAVNENCSQRNHRVSKEVHHQTIIDGAKLVADLGVRFAGIDIICKDISQPLGHENGLISEINTTPGIHHHYLVSADCKQVPVAEHVLEYMFKSRQGVMKIN